MTSICPSPNTERSNRRRESKTFDVWHLGSHPAKPVKLRKLNGVRYVLVLQGLSGDVAAASASAVHGRRETNTTLVCQTEYQH